jgi:hypothetical protein
VGSVIGRFREGALDPPQTFYQAESTGLRGDSLINVYSGTNFEVCDSYSPQEFQDLWGKGAIVERKMPCPTRKRPDRTKTVYYWIGEDSASIRGLSCQMPARVTQLNAEGSYLHVQIVKSWKPQFAVVFA